MPDFVSRFVSATDGLRLHARDYELPRVNEAVPASPVVVCLPGLARTAADFDTLAKALLQGGVARRVLALDYRGRGQSDRDPDPANYDLRIESDDILAVLAALDVGSAVFVGTSRGGLHIMLLAAVRPALLAGAVINDIGPVIEPRGLARIRGYVGKLPEPRSWADAVDLLRGLASAQFTALGPADWDAYARTTFEERDGRFVPLYDPALMHNLEKLDLNAVPTLWPQFGGLSHLPILAVRGANSDILSLETMAEMVKRHPDCEVLMVPGQGHAPLLTDEASTGRIVAFVHSCGSERRATDSARRGLAMLG